jgi:antitoxin VapB
MKTAKLFQHGGSQAVRLPKAFRFSGKEVSITRRGDEVVLRAKAGPTLASLAEVARRMSAHHPAARHFPKRTQPTRQQPRDLVW